MFGWPPVPASAAAHRRKAFVKDAICAALLGIGLYVLGAVDSASTSGDDATASTVNHAPPLWSGLALLGGLASLIGDVYVMPPPEEGDKNSIHVWQTLETPLGHCAYFTVQTLVTQCVYLALAFAGDVTGDPADARATCLVALWQTVQAIALAVLFLVHNWYEKRWRETVLYVLEKKYPGWKYLVLFTHIAPAVVAVADLFLLRDAAAILRYGPGIRELLIITVAYGAGYMVWIQFVRHVLSPGTLIYPFVADLNTVYDCVKFATEQSVFIGVLSVVLYFLLGTTV